MSSDFGQTWVASNVDPSTIVTPDGRTTLTLGTASITRTDVGTLAIGSGGALDLIYTGSGDFQIASQAGAVTTVPAP